MTTSLQTPTTQPAQAVGQAAGTAATARFPRRLALGILVVLLIFAGTYAFAWYNAYSLSERFIRDADASYDQGDFLHSLVGYQKFDQQTNKYINYGGYVSVEKIWNNRFSWPIPPAVQRARQRSQEIVADKLTTEQAEQYILENTGRPGAPYFGEIYLRLGELYEQQGDVRDARDVYESIPSLFPNRPDLIQKAKALLDRLEGS